MKKNNAQEQKALEKKVNMFNVFLIFVLTPMTILGAISIPILTAVVNLLQMIMGCTLIFKAVVFGGKLSKSMSGIDSAKPLVKSIMKTIYIAVSFTVLLFLTVFANFGLQGTFVAWQMIFWIGIHAGEIGMYYALLITKRDQTKKRIAPVDDKSSVTEGAEH